MKGRRLLALLHSTAAEGIGAARIIAAAHALHLDGRHGGRVLGHTIRRRNEVQVWWA
jgi:hypothetical protein